MVQIIPAILATTEEDYREKIQQVDQVESLKGGWVQIDLMDNKFVDNQSIRPEVIGKYPVSQKLEAHLMVKYPDNWIDGLVKAGVDRIIFPVDDSEGIVERIRNIKSYKKQVGLALDPETPVNMAEPFLSEVDVVLLLSVQPGFQGQEFISETLGKVKKMVSLRLEKNLNFLIEVDGGITPANAKSVVDVGADILVVGSHLLNDGNIEAGLEDFWEVLRG